MTTAINCDRCGKLVTEFKMTGNLVPTTATTAGARAERVCSDCERTTPLVAVDPAYRAKLAATYVGGADVAVDDGVDSIGYAIGLDDAAKESGRVEERTAIERWVYSLGVKAAELGIDVVTVKKIHVGILRGSYRL